MKTVRTVYGFDADYFTKSCGQIANLVRTVFSDRPHGIHILSALLLEPLRTICTIIRRDCLSEQTGSQKASAASFTRSERFSAAALRASARTASVSSAAIVRSASSQATIIVS